LLLVNKFKQLLGSQLQLHQINVDTKKAAAMLHLLPYPRYEVISNMKHGWSHNSHVE